MDLLDWHRERLTARRLSVLIRHLPRDSAVNRDLYGEAAEWSVTDHLLAAVVDHLAAANWMFACVNTAEDGDQPEPPAPVPRPGDTTPDQDPGHTSDGPSNASQDTGAPSPVQLARFFG
ncbi:hypothetical protein ACFYWX_27430 [Streptomyces sp. NPDC002888]|uniref:hypothetical protein n=1 Tax=Streptomyces sp. NPDC002888 TaxID=3364668 RepID=UPI0036A9AA04